MVLLAILVSPINLYYPVYLHYGTMVHCHMVLCSVRMAVQLSYMARMSELHVLRMDVLYDVRYTLVLYIQFHGYEDTGMGHMENL